MAQLGKLQIKTKDIVEKLTMEVQIKGIRSFHYRAKLAVFLIRVACKVLGCKVDIKLRG